MKIFLCALVFLTSCVYANPDKIVTEVITHFMQEKGIPGLSVAYFDGQQEHYYNFGLADVPQHVPVTSDTIFEIASITKVFTSTQLALEVVRGKMNLKDPVVKYLPALSNANSQIAKITLSDLATHTSSLPRVPPSRKNGWNHQKIIQYLRKWSPSYPIGTKYVYSNLGFGVLGYAEANLEGIDFYDVIRRDILIPLNMTSTFIHVPPALMNRYALGYNKDGGPAPHYALNAWPAGGALRSTASDMMKFMKANLGLVGPAELQQAMQLAQQGIFKVNDNMTLGLGWQRFQGKSGVLFVDKNGGVDGFSSYIGIIPDRKMGVVLLANKAKTNITEAGRELLNRIVHAQTQAQSQAK